MSFIKLSPEIFDFTNDSISQQDRILKWSQKIFNIQLVYEFFINKYKM